MQTSTKALERAQARVRQGFDQGYSVDSVAAFIAPAGTKLADPATDVGPDVDRRLWAWWMTMHKPGAQPKNANAYRRYYEAVYEELELLWLQKRML